MTTVSTIVTADSKKDGGIGHVRLEWPVTIRWNERSRSFGIGGHVGVEYAGKRKSGRIRRGNPWIRRLLCEFAQAAARTRCGLKAKFESLMVRKGYKKAIVALAHKMLRIIYAMLSNGTHYKDSTVDYEALTVARNAPRWLKMLRKHGFITDAATA